MPHAEFDADIDPIPFLDPEFIQYLEDREFDLIYPDDVRLLSDVHWTPVSAARTAARFLVTGPHTRVLDIGCGPGKFCALGASCTEGHFTGVEQRANLVRAGEKMIRHYSLPRVRLIHANMKDIRFADYHAFYLFNPFAENIWLSAKMDSQVETGPHLYNDYCAHVARELANLPVDTRVVTFWGDGDEIPRCYDCVNTACGGQMKFWIKKHHSAAATATAAVVMGANYVLDSPFAAL